MFKAQRKISGRKWYHLGFGDRGYGQNLRNKIATGAKKYRGQKREIGKKIIGRYEQ
jgi:hypothetical protein